MIDTPETQPRSGPVLFEIISSTGDIFGPFKTAGEAAAWAKKRWPDQEQRDENGSDGWDLREVAILARVAFRSPPSINSIFPGEAFNLIGRSQDQDTVLMQIDLMLMCKLVKIEAFRQAPFAPTLLAIISDPKPVWLPVA